MRRVVVLLSFFAGLGGCVSEDAKPGDDGVDVDLGEAALAASLVPSETIGTVATVTVVTPTAAEVWIEVQEPGGPVRSFPAESDAEGTAHRAVLAGLAAATEYTWQARATLADGEARASAPDVFATEAPPMWLPALAQPVEAEDPWAPGFVLTTFIGEVDGAAIVDRQGRYVWWWEPPDGMMPCQARIGLDGASVTLMVVDRMMSDDVGMLARVELDGTVRWSTRAPLGHHDFVELEDGRIGYLAFDLRMLGPDTIVGDQLVLLDPETGVETKLWSTWDDLGPGPELEPSFYAFGVDWTHANGLAVDPVTGDWLMSLHNLDTIARVRPAGGLHALLGGEKSDFALTGGDGFAYQHSPVVTDEGILLFDNRRPEVDALYSRAVEYRIDEEAGTYEEIWSFAGNRDLFTAFQGSVERTDRGTTLIGWGSAGRITEVAGSAEVVWQLESAVGAAFGFTHTVATLGESLQ